MHASWPEFEDAKPTSERPSDSEKKTYACCVRVLRMLRAANAYASWHRRRHGHAVGTPNLRAHARDVTRCIARERDYCEGTRRDIAKQRRATPRDTARAPLCMAASTSAPVHAAHARRAGQVALRGNVDEAQVEQRALVSRQEAVVPRLAALRLQPHARAIVGDRQLAQRWRLHAAGNLQSRWVRRSAACLGRW